MGDATSKGIRKDFIFPHVSDPNRLKITKKKKKKRKQKERKKERKKTLENLKKPKKKGFKSFLRA